MGRCNECNSVLAKKDNECYVCGTPVPGTKRSSQRKKEQKPAPPISPTSNLFLIASLALTLVAFLLRQTAPICLSLALSAILVVMRVVSDRKAAAKQLALGPVAVSRLHN